MKIQTLAGATLLVGMLTAANVRAEPLYAATGLGPPAEDFSAARSINDDGRLVGQAPESQAVRRAFGSAARTPESIAADRIALASLDTFAGSANGTGEVVGYSFGGRRRSTAFVHSGDFTRDFNSSISLTLGLGVATDINASGHLTGQRSDYDIAPGFSMTPMAEPCPVWGLILGLLLIRARHAAHSH